MPRVGLIRAKRTRVGRIKGFIGEERGRKGQAEAKEGGDVKGRGSPSQ